eukprot:464364-Prymnesium_polylepis.1
MFDCPTGTPSLYKDESVFSTQQLNSLISAAKGRPLLHVAEELILKELANLGSWARQEKVVVVLHCTPFEEAIELIAAEQPWSMSWSNVIDYVCPATFHRLARACSTHGGTMHFGYSMNWTDKVFGTCLMDFFCEQAERCRILDLCVASWSGLYKQLGWHETLRSPPPENPYNLTYQLELGHHWAWAKHWFGIARHS